VLHSQYYNREIPKNHWNFLGNLALEVLFCVCSIFSLTWGDRGSTI